MIACYLRVSTDDQDNTAQRAALGQWLVAHGHDLDAVSWYEDTATGANLDRPAFERMQADIFAGKIKTVVVYKLDRLSRDIADGVNLLCGWIDRKIRIVATSQQLDFSGTLGKMNAAILMSLGQIEREYIRERQNVGITLAKEKGVYQGRKPGSLQKKGRSADIDIVSRTAELRASGWTVAAIMDELRIARGTVYRYLRLAEEREIEPANPPIRPVMESVQWPKKV